MSEQTSDSPVKKPPLGIISHTIYYNDRIAEISEAIERRKAADEEIPLDWIKEYSILIKLKNS